MSSQCKAGYVGPSKTSISATSRGRRRGHCRASQAVAGRRGEMPLYLSRAYDSVAYRRSMPRTHQDTVVARAGGTRPLPGPLATRFAEKTAPPWSRDVHLQHGEYRLAAEVNIVTLRGGGPVFHMYLLLTV